MQNTRLRLVSSVIFLTVLARCSSTQEITPSVVDRPIDSIQASNTPEFLQAQEFDQIMKGEASPTTVKALRKTCKKTNENPFCLAIRKWNSLQAFLQIQKRRGVPVAPKETKEVTPLWKGSQVTNWKALQKARIPELIKGVEKSSPEQFAILKTKAIKQKGCPNAMAVAIAATLEDGLPDKANKEEIADLYLKGARCTRKNPTDKEHFQTRAALFLIANGNWKRAESVLKQVNPNDYYSSRALYWLQRAQTQLGDINGAQKTLKRMEQRHPFAFHTLLIAEKQDPSFFLPYTRSQPEKESTTTLSKESKFLRIQLQRLDQFGFKTSRQRLLNWALTAWKLPFKERLALAKEADDSTRIRIAAELIATNSPLLNRETMLLSYPASYLTVFEKNANSLVPSYLGLAIAKKESAFDPLAVSVANAQGLLQLNPTTSLKLHDGKEVNLFEPETNIETGMRYLKSLMERWNGSAMHAIASYNAGEDAVIVWTKRYPNLEPILWLDLIPYRETRDYVGFVLSNRLWYQALYGNGSGKNSLF